MSKKHRVKALAVGVIRHQQTILIGEGEDPSTKKTFYRPIGGSIEFGERGRDAVAREFQEELGVRITQPKLLGVVENLFTYDGEPGHEIMLIFEANLHDPSLYTRPSFKRLDKPGRALWMPLATFQARQAQLYPDGLLSLL